MVFIRTSCADIARPGDLEDRQRSDRACLFPLQRAGDLADPPVQERQRRLILRRHSRRRRSARSTARRCCRRGWAGAARGTSSRRVIAPSSTAAALRRRPSRGWKSMSCALNPGVEALAMFDASIPMRCAAHFECRTMYPEQTVVGHRAGSCALIRARGSAKAVPDVASRVEIAGAARRKRQGLAGRRQADCRFAGGPASRRGANRSSRRASRVRAR